MASDVTRVEIGFDGGLIVITKIDKKEWDALDATIRSGKGVAQFSGDDDSTYLVDVSKISYVKHESHVGRVGF
jgi:type 1 glutamine amidotransferase